MLIPPARPGVRVLIGVAVCLATAGAVVRAPRPLTTYPTFSARPMRARRQQSALETVRAASAGLVERGTAFLDARREASVETESTGDLPSTVCDSVSDGKGRVSQEQPGSPPIRLVLRC